MKRVCLFNFPPIQDFHGYHIETFDPLAYFPKQSTWSLADLISAGRNGYDHRRAVFSGAAGVDRLYRERNVHYMRMVDDFVDRFREFDLVIMATYNFVHPEILSRQLVRPIKVLGFVDDPPSTYLRGIPYIWAFDGAFHISPSYIDGSSFEESLKRWTHKPTLWWPLVPFELERPANASDSFFRDRDVELIYVGNPTGSKMERLIRLKRHFGRRLRVHGRWALAGYLGFARSFLGMPIYPHRVTGITVEERNRLYWRTRIGFNMHVSDQRNETGNARMYELPAHGIMMVCDKASGNAHERVFAPEREAVYYESLDEAISLIEHYLANDEERIRIARNGFDRFWKDYSWEMNLLRLLDWASSLRGRTE